MYEAREVSILRGGESVRSVDGAIIGQTREKVKEVVYRLDCAAWILHRACWSLPGCWGIRVPLSMSPPSMQHMSPYAMNCYNNMLI